MAETTKMMQLLTFKQDSFTCVRINAHLLSHCAEDKRCQMAFYRVSSTLYSTLIIRSNSTSLSIHIWLPVFCAIVVIDVVVQPLLVMCGFQFSSGFWLASVSLRCLNTLLPPGLKSKTRPAAAVVDSQARKIAAITAVLLVCSKMSSLKPTLLLITDKLTESYSL